MNGAAANVKREIFANLIRNLFLSYSFQALGARLKDNLGASMLPYFTMFICSNLGGIIADFMIERKVSVGTTRKFINTSGFVATALALLEIPSAQTATGCSVRHPKCIQQYCPSHVACLFVLSCIVSLPYMQLFASIALGSGAIARGGFSVNHMDIGAQYAGVLMVRWHMHYIPPCTNRQGDMKAFRDKHVYGL